MSTISINQFLARINFKQVAFIEPVSSGVGSKSAGVGGGDVVSAVHFIGSSTLLTAQPLAYFRALAHGRMLDVPATDFKTGLKTKRLVPRDADHHLELVSGQEDQTGSSGEAAEARIVYRAFDPVHSERRFQMPVAPSLIDVLLDRDTDGVIDIGGGKFVFADDVENARALVPRNIARMARCPHRSLCRPSKAWCSGPCRPRFCLRTGTMLIVRRVRRHSHALCRRCGCEEYRKSRTMQSGPFI